MESSRWPGNKKEVHFNVLEVVCCCFDLTSVICSCMFMSCTNKIFQHLLHVVVGCNSTSITVQVVYKKLYTTSTTCPLFLLLHTKTIFHWLFVDSLTMYSISNHLSLSACMRCTCSPNFSIGTALERSLTTRMEQKQGNRSTYSFMT